MKQTPYDRKSLVHLGLTTFYNKTNNLYASPVKGKYIEIKAFFFYSELKIANDTFLGYLIWVTRWVI